MGNPSPKWEENAAFMASRRSPDKDKGPMVQRPICFKAWQDLHDVLANLPNKQAWLRDAVYHAAKVQGLLKTDKGDEANDKGETDEQSDAR
ncbi:MAG: hypothetical protein AAGD25_41225 [Cyanobacteria bacterium P01_F01_bin.150]